MPPGNYWITKNPCAIMKTHCSGGKKRKEMRLREKSVMSEVKQTFKKEDNLLLYKLSKEEKKMIRHSISFMILIRH